MSTYNMGFHYDMGKRVGYDISCPNNIDRRNLIMSKLDEIIVDMSNHPQVVNSFTIGFNLVVDARLKQAKSNPITTVKLPSMEEYLSRKRYITRHTKNSKR